jgi:hypothetical protein
MFGSLKARRLIAAEGTALPWGGALVGTACVASRSRSPHSGSQISQEVSVGSLALSSVQGATWARHQNA